MYLEKYLIFVSLFFAHLEKRTILLLSINEPRRSNIKKQSASNLVEQLKFHESVDRVISKSKSDEKYENERGGQIVSRGTGWKVVRRSP